MFQRQTYSNVTTQLSDFYRMVYISAPCIAVTVLCFCDTHQYSVLPLTYNSKTTWSKRLLLLSTFVCHKRRGAVSLYWSIPYLNCHINFQLHQVNWECYSLIKGTTSVLCRVCFIHGLFSISYIHWYTQSNYNKSCGIRIMYFFKNTHTLKCRRRVTAGSVQNNMISDCYCSVLDWVCEVTTVTKSH